MLDPGSKAPDFFLKDQNGKDFRLTDVVGKKNIVLYFYPKNETPGCTKEACAFRDHYETFTDAGAEVIGISTDSVESHQKFAQNRNLPFVLLSDPGFAVHRLYDACPSFFGIWKARITYVIDREGTIRHAFHSQFQVQKHVEDALKTIQELA